MKKVTNFKDYMADEQRVSAEELEAVNFEKSIIMKTVEGSEALRISAEGLVISRDI